MKEEVYPLLDFGMQPISNRYLADPAEAEYTHPFVIGVCESCGLIQIDDPVPARELKPRFDWVSYAEPEAHLDRLADTIRDLPGITPASTICGISFIDDSVLRRMSERGFENTWRVDAKSDLGIDDPRAGIETIQERLAPEAMMTLAQDRGRPDVLIARHILEHAHDVPRFMAALKELVSPDGYIVFEVPDCTSALEHDNFLVIVWEEHLSYFTPHTFRQIFAIGGLSLVRLDSFSYPLENALVGTARGRGGIAPSPPANNVLEETARITGYSDTLGHYRQKISNYLSAFRVERGKIALLGAGHLTCTFVNLLELSDAFEFVVDDNPNKQGMYMPGSRLPIVASASLRDQDIKLCLMGVSPESEPAVVRKNRPFLENGGVFRSIFPDSDHAIRF